MTERYDFDATAPCGYRERPDGDFVAYGRYRDLAARLAEADKANQLLRVDIAAAAREEDLILAALRLDPERYRTECGYLNVPKIVAAIKNPDMYPRTADRLADMERDLQAMAITLGRTQERLDEAEGTRAEWLKANGPGGWIDVQRKRLAEVEALLQEVYDCRHSPMSIGLVYRIGHTLNHRTPDSASD